VSVFAEYRHFWWAEAPWNASAASPAYNYMFLRRDDLLSVGFTVNLSRRPVATVTLPVK
jgi:hypothetical protein